MPFRIKYTAGFSELIVMTETAVDALDAVYRVLGDQSRDDLIVIKDGEEIALGELTMLALKAEDRT
jgi:hypothetical protein